jgi:hypothetical protein
LQIFASYLSAVHRAVTIPGFDENGPVAALALSAAAVHHYLVPYTSPLLTHHCQAERVLKLWRNGHITWESTTMHDGKQRSSPIMSILNEVTGRESNRALEFNQSNWGDATDGYVSSIQSNHAKGKLDFNAIISEAMKFVKPGRRADSSGVPSMESENCNTRAALEDDSD